jgi:hypothetical protein
MGVRRRYRPDADTGTNERYKYFLLGRGRPLHTSVALLQPPTVQSGIYEQASGIFLAYFAHEGSGFDTVLMQGL